MPDDRSPLAHALGAAYMVIGICFQLVIPILLGYWVDQRLDTHGIFIVVGVIIGAFLGGVGLFQFAKHSQTSFKATSKPKKEE